MAKLMPLDHVKPSLSRAPVWRPILNDKEIGPDEAL